MESADEFRLLIVDDEPDLRKAMGRFLINTPYKLLYADSGNRAIEITAEANPTLMLLDLRMPGMNGFEVLESVLKTYPGLKVIILTGNGGVPEAVRAIKMGALDFFEKPISPHVLRNRIEQVYTFWKLEKENQQLQNRLSDKFRFDELVGEAPSMLKLKEMVIRIAPTNTSILIQGGSGTGKELIAQALHIHSTRASEIFMPVDCASITESVMESEMFGHSKGAFTGADRSSLGLFRSADGGTLFLDEIGELSMSMQAKLLRSIQERTVRPVGSTSLIPVDVRIVAATNRNLMEDAENGLFRLDLYYRLSAITLKIPSLSERREDIPELCIHLCKRLQSEGLPPKQLSEEAIASLSRHKWPGNVRELENVLRNCMAFSTGEVIRPEDLPFSETISSGQNIPFMEGSGSMSDYEAEAIRKTLENTSGNRRKAAKILGISEATLYRRIKEFGL
jgi:DNA-binding NtrC family response regulator